MSIVTEAPIWLIALCLAAGLIYAGALYFRDRFNRTYGSFLASVLGVIRFVCVSLLAFFLLKPLIKSVSNDVEKPIIVIAQDNSESLVVGKDSSYYKGEYQQQLSALIQQFGENYELRTYNFGSGVNEGIDSLLFNEKQTDFSKLLDEAYNKFSGRNLGAIIVASDGLYNKGSNPIYSYQKLNAPVFTIALGDTTVHRDVLLSDVAVNRLAYLGNKFPMRITVEGRKAQGESATLSVSRKGQNLFTKQIAFNGERYAEDVNVILDATEIGLQKYTVTISSVSDEITYANNRKDIFIDVLDSRQKVLILAYSPHPDLNALRDAMVSNKSYQVDLKLAEDFSGNIADYSLVIFHQLPAVGGNGKAAIDNTLKANVPSMFVWGAQTDFRSFTDLKLGYSLEFYRNSNTDVSGSYEESFSLFTLDEETKMIFKSLPPLQVPFGDLAFSPGAISLINQQVGQIKTKNPLVSFNKTRDNNKICLIAGEGIWRWRMGAFQQFERHDYFNGFVTKVVQYMASKEDRSLFRVNGKNDFIENESIMFDAEVYNASYEPITNREIKMTIRNEEGQNFDYTFSPNETRYRLNVGQLPVGNYSYTAAVMTDAGTQTEKGEFSVSALQYELVNTIADHRLLYQFAHDNNGEMVYPQNMNSLVDMIKNKKEIVSVSYENKQLKDLINYKWILALLTALLGTEWLLRKRAGTY
ncbi:MAG: hypothetical protein ACKVOR_00770 [Flavobacteriales bacterium]